MNRWCLRSFQRWSITDVSRENIPRGRGYDPEGSVSEATESGMVNGEQANVWGPEGLGWGLWMKEVREVLRAMRGFVSEGKDFVVVTELNWEPVTGEVCQSDVLQGLGTGWGHWQLNLDELEGFAQYPRQDPTAVVQIRGYKSMDEGTRYQELLIDWVDFGLEEIQELRAAVRVTWRLMRLKGPEYAPNGWE